MFKKKLQFHVNHYLSYHDMAQTNVAIGPRTLHCNGETTTFPNEISRVNFEDDEV